MTRPKELCAHCGQILPIRQALCVWVPLITVVVEGALRFVR